MTLLVPISYMTYVDANVVLQSNFCAQYYNLSTPCQFTGGYFGSYYKLSCLGQVQDQLVWLIGKLAEALPFCAATQARLRSTVRN